MLPVQHEANFALQAGDFDTLGRIGRLAPTSGQSADDQLVIEASALCTTLARGLAIFERWSGVYEALSGVIMLTQQSCRI